MWAAATAWQLVIDRVRQAYGPNYAARRAQAALRPGQPLPAQPQHRSERLSLGPELTHVCSLPIIVRCVSRGIGGSPGRVPIGHALSSQSVAFAHVFEPRLRSCHGSTPHAPRLGRAAARALPERARSRRRPGARRLPALRLYADASHAHVPDLRGYDMYAAAGFGVPPA